MDVTRRNALGLAAGWALVGGSALAGAGPRVKPLAGAYTYTTLHDFSPTEGKRVPRWPEQGVVLASDGLLYALNSDTDIGEPGNAFRLAVTGGDVEVTHRFGRTATAGIAPSGALLEGPDGHFYGVTYYGGAFGLGTAFRMHPNGFVKTLHDFAGGTGDGASPHGPLLLADDGWFYGTTYAGGSKANRGDGRGTLYRLKASGEYELLHSFLGTPGGDGSRPTSALVQAPDGWLYGVTTYGGINDVGTIFRIAGATGYETLYSFAKDRIGYGPALGLTAASDGLLYGATRFAGGKGSGAIFRVAPGAEPEQLHSIDRFDEGEDVSSRLVEGPDGLLYFTFAIGEGFPGTVCRLDRGTGGVEVVHAFQRGDEGGDPQGDLALGPDGSWYGTLRYSPGGLGAVYRLTPG